MKILMVNKFLYPRGGAETYMLKVAEQLEKMGNQVEFFGMYDEKNTVFNSIGEYTTNFDFHTRSLKRVAYPFKIIYSFEAKKKIEKVINSFQPDVIHMNNINFQLTPSIIDTVKNRDISLVQTVHDYQMVCPNHLLFDVNTKKPCEKCINGSKWNCALNNCIHESKAKSIIGTLEALLYKKRKTYSKVDLYICPSLFLEKMLLKDKTFLGKTKSIHNYIELPKLTDEIMEKSDYVLFFGRLSEEKGLDIFAEACKLLPDIKFKIAGTGPLEGLCKSIENAEYVGFKTGAELQKLVGNALFTVYPSIWYENCPLSILESEALGTPVITTGWGGMMELVEHAETGILVNNMSADSLASAIRDLYDNKNMITYMSKKCLEKRENMISLNDYCEKLVNIYNELL